MPTHTKLTGKGLDSKRCTQTIDLEHYIASQTFFPTDWQWNDTNNQWERWLDINLLETSKNDPN